MKVIHLILAIRFLIDPRLADRRENLTCHPVLELAGLRFVGAHDEPIQARLGEYLDGLSPCCVATSFGLYPIQPNFIWVDVAKSRRDIGLALLIYVQSEGLANIGSDEPRFTFDGYDADGVGVEVEGGRERLHSPTHKSSLCFRGFVSDAQDCLSG